MPTKDKNKQKEIRKRCYQKNKKFYILREKLRTLENTLQFKSYKLTLKCDRCGFNDGRAIHFHHKNPEEKEYNISNLYRKFIPKLEKEISKCEIICANCHLIEHFVSENEVIKKIEDLKKEILKLKPNFRKFKREKDKKCKVCESTDNLKKGKRYCVKCYNEFQKEVMKKRRLNKTEL